MTYEELISSVLTMLKREEDAELSATLPTYMRFVESEINRRTRVIEMEKRARRSVEGGRWAYGWPNDYLGLRSIKIVSGDDGRTHNMELIAPEQFTSLQETSCNCASPSTQGVDWYYTVHNDNYSIMPVPCETDGAYIEIIYHASIPPLGMLDSLGATIESNWLSEKYPDIYFYGICKHCQPFIFDDTRLAVMGTLYKEAVDGLISNNTKQTWSGTTQRVRVRGHR